jgi:hypothetical protein
MDEEAYDRAWMQGRHSALNSIMLQCLRELGYSEREAQIAKLAAEREEAIAMLRQVCAEHGDNDWEDSLHLADIIENHLWRHLEEPD